MYASAPMSYNKKFLKEKLTLEGAGDLGGIKRRNGK